MNLAGLVGMTALKKSLRAQQSHLKKEMHQLESIQIDLGVNLMTGNIIREKVNHEFTNMKLFEQTIETMNTYTAEQRGSKSVVELIKIVKQMKFFQESGMNMPLSDEDALIIAKRLQYRFVPKGQAIRMALDKSKCLYYIMAGKAVCSFPQEKEFEERARKKGIDLTLAGISN